MADNSLFGWLFLILVLGGGAFMLLRDSLKRRRAEREYRESLLHLRRNRNSPDSRMRATRAGEAYYGLKHKDGKPTLFDREQITKEIQETTGESQSQKPSSPPVVKTVREAQEYRNM